MSARKVETTTVAKGEYRNFRDKGLEFFHVMKTCLQDGDWDAVVLNGVHASISLSDAVTVFRLGRRSTSQSHSDAATLLNEAVREREEGRQQSNRLAQILNWKHDSEYEPTRASEREATDFAKLVERFVTWCQSILP